VNGKNFDALGADGTLWEVKTGDLGECTSVPGLIRTVADIRRTADIAAACLIPFKVLATEDCVCQALRGNLPNIAVVCGKESGKSACH
jgi:hypothetical protein